jgi:hypothetical protein
MSHSDDPLRRLIGIKIRERAAARAARLAEAVRKVETHLGARVMDALNQAAEPIWEFRDGQAERRFFHAGDTFLLVVYGSNELSPSAQVELHLSARDLRDEDCHKRADISEANEDWFIDSLQFICEEASSIRKR